MFVTNERAMVVSNYLVIAELHLGITRELYESGISMPSQVKPLAAKINRLKKAAKAKNLIIVGDVKHKVPGISWQEVRELPEFLSLLKFSKIIIIKGNHDGGIEKMIPHELREKVAVKKSFSMGDYFFSHGHRNVSTKKKIIVIAHTHPLVGFRDRFGALYAEPCWVRGKTGDKKLVIMPAFNELCGGVMVNKNKLLGPVAKKIRKARIYLLDGTDLGYLKDLKIKE